MRTVVNFNQGTGASHAVCLVEMSFDGIFTSISVLNGKKKRKCKMKGDKWGKTVF